ncbi:hypothetical protein ACF0H5_012120 [Mactra antiquata]
MDSGSNSGLMRCSSCGLSESDTSFSISDSFHENTKRCDTCIGNIGSADGDQTHPDGIESLVNELKNQNRDTVDVILLLGLPGTGKSSFINTLHKALIGKYKPIAKAGAGIDQSITADITWYEHCGVDDLYNVPDPTRKRQLGSIVEKLPHLVDLAGFDNDKKYATTLELLIGGCIEPGVNSQELQNTDEATLRLRFSKPNPDLKITKICFVQSVVSPPPEDLIACVKSVLRKTDPTTFHRKYNIPMFLILSKWDLVRYAPPDTNPFGDLTSDVFTDLAVANKRKDEMLSYFNMTGSSEHSFQTWTSYSSHPNLDNRFIDKNALEFLYKLIQPIKPKPIPPPIDCMTMVKIKLLHISRKVKHAIPVLVIAVIVQLLLKGLEERDHTNGTSGLKAG